MIIKTFIISFNFMLDYILLLLFICLFINDIQLFYINNLFIVILLFNLFNLVN